VKFQRPVSSAAMRYSSSDRFAPHSRTDQRSFGSCRVTDASMLFLAVTGDRLDLPRVEMKRLGQVDTLRVDLVTFVHPDHAVVRDQRGERIVYAGILDTGKAEPGEEIDVWCRCKDALIDAGR
jgi:hypothetical protein